GSTGSRRRSTSSAARLTSSWARSAALASTSSALTSSGRRTGGATSSRCLVIARSRQATRQSRWEEPLLERDCVAPLAMTMELRDRRPHPAAEAAPGDEEADQHQVGE